eukprot:g28965.t1
MDLEQLETLEAETTAPHTEDGALAWPESLTMSEEVHYSQQWCVELATFMVGKNPALYIAKTEGGRGRSIRFIEDGQPGELATTPTKTDFPLIIVPAKDGEDDEWVPTSPREDGALAWPESLTMSEEGLTEIDFRGAETTAAPQTAAEQSEEMRIFLLDGALALPESFTATSGEVNVPSFDGINEEETPDCLDEALEQNDLKRLLQGVKDLCHVSHEVRGLNRRQASAERLTQEVLEELHRKGDPEKVDGKQISDERLASREHFTSALAESKDAGPERRRAVRPVEREERIDRLQKEGVPEDEEMSDQQQRQVLARHVSECVKSRDEVTERRGAMCLAESVCPGILTEIRVQKHQASKVEACVAHAQKALAKADADLEKLKKHQGRLDQNSKYLQKLCREYDTKVKQDLLVVWDALYHFGKACLNNVSIREFLYAIEDKTQEAITEAEDEMTLAEPAYRNAVQAAHSAAREAKKRAQQIHEKSKEAAQRLNDVVKEGAQKSLENAEPCEELVRQLAERKLVERRPLRGTAVEATPERWISTVLALPCNVVEEADDKYLAPYLRSKKEVERLEKAEQEIRAEISKAETLHRKATDLMEDLTPGRQMGLSELDYLFDWEEIQELAKGLVDEAYGPPLFQESGSDSGSSADSDADESRDESRDGTDGPTCTRPVRRRDSRRSDMEKLLEALKTQEKLVEKEKEYRQAEATANRQKMTIIEEQNGQNRQQGEELRAIRMQLAEQQATIQQLLSRAPAPAAPVGAVTDGGAASDAGTELGSWLDLGSAEGSAAEAAAEVAEDEDEEAEGSEEPLGPG